MEVATFGPLDFRHLDRRGSQITGDRSPVAAGSLYPGAPHGAQALSPTHQAPVALRGRGHTQLAQASAKTVQGHCHVDVEVCVHAHDHLRGRLLGVDHHHVRRAPFDVALASHPTRRTDDTVTGHLTGASSYEVTTLRPRGGRWATPRCPVDESLARHLWLT